MNHSRQFPVKEFCDRVLKDLQSKGSLDPKAIHQLKFLNQLNRHWRAICGPLLFPHLKPKGIRGHTLVLEATHNLWAEQARCYQEELLKRLKEHIPWLIVSQIRFEAGTNQPVNASGNPKPTPRPQCQDSFHPVRDANNKLSKILELLKSP